MAGSIKREADQMLRAGMSGGGPAESSDGTVATRTQANDELVLLHQKAQVMTEIFDGDLLKGHLLTFEQALEDLAGRLPVEHVSAENMRPLIAAVHAECIANSNVNKRFSDDITRLQLGLSAVGVMTGELYKDALRTARKAGKGASFTFGMMRPNVNRIKERLSTLVDLRDKMEQEYRDEFRHLEKDSAIAKLFALVSGVDGNYKQIEADIRRSNAPQDDIAARLGQLKMQLSFKEKRVDMFDVEFESLQHDKKQMENSISALEERRSAAVSSQADDLHDTVARLQQMSQEDLANFKRKNDEHQAKMDALQSQLVPLELGLVVSEDNSLVDGNSAPRLHYVIIRDSSSAVSDHFMQQCKDTLKSLIDVSVGSGPKMPDWVSDISFDTTVTALVQRSWEEVLNEFSVSHSTPSAGMLTEAWRQAAEIVKHASEAHKQIALEAKQKSPLHTIVIYITPFGDPRDGQKWYQGWFGKTMKDQMPDVQEQVETLSKYAMNGDQNCHHQCRGIVMVQGGVAHTLKSAMEDWIRTLNGMDMFRDHAGVNFELLFHKDTHPTSTVTRTVKAIVAGALSDSAAKQTLLSDARSKQFWKDKQVLDSHGLVMAEQQKTHAENLMKLLIETGNLKKGQDEMITEARAKVEGFYTAEIDKKKHHLSDTHLLEARLEARRQETAADIQQIKDSIHREEGLLSTIRTMVIDEAALIEEYKRIEADLRARFGSLDWKGLKACLTRLRRLQARNPVHINGQITGLDMIIAPLAAKLEDMESTFDGKTEERSMPFRVLYRFAQNCPEAVKDPDQDTNANLWWQIVRHLTPKDTVDKDMVEVYTDAVQLEDLVMKQCSNNDEEWKKQCAAKREESLNNMKIHLAKSSQYLDTDNDIDTRKKEIERLRASLEDKEFELKKLKKEVDPEDKDEKMEKKDKVKGLEIEIKEIQKEIAALEKENAKEIAGLDLMLKKDHEKLFRIVHPKVCNEVFEVSKKIILGGGADEFVETLNSVKDIFQKNVGPHLAMINDVVKTVLKGSADEHRPAAIGDWRPQKQARLQY